MRVFPSTQTPSFPNDLCSSSLTFSHILGTSKSTVNTNTVMYVCTHCVCWLYRDRTDNYQSSFHHMSNRISVAALAIRCHLTKTATISVGALFFTDFQPNSEGFHCTDITGTVKADT